MSTCRTRSFSLTEIACSTPQCADALWPISTSSCQHQKHSDFDAADHGVDAFHRKRRHRDNSPPEAFSSSRPCGQKSKLDEKPRFATTPSEFKLSSRTRCLNESVWRPQPFVFKPFSEDRHECLPDLVRLRSSAFWELRQSITENGEGLVRRMRNYERSRSRNQVYQKAKEAEKRGRKRLSRLKKTYVNLSETSDDDEILISSVEFSKNVLCSAVVGKRARSVDDMDIDVQSDGWASAHLIRSRSSNPSADYAYGMLNMLSNECQPLPLEGLSLTVSSDPSSPSTSACNPAKSSLFSLPLPSPNPTPNDWLPSSTNEKAVAALSLAMENGAGSINDYPLVWNYQGQSIRDQSHDIGELWH
ncbi:hypothetical protein CPB84DRAFT_1759544 [Gymnopilus junonius]|uniref:Uncharacterized protein n=1 Tax=Gymnopilus junonius TaxID=109634 RepID=A0A9P5P1Y5_GYMJU|nr:hypothetical protein CPB84DRAFT_1759544 [Gymnopilus junonius]